jgi:hypothetical protein
MQVEVFKYNMVNREVRTCVMAKRNQIRVIRGSRVKLKSSGPGDKFKINEQSLLGL